MVCDQKPAGVMTMAAGALDGTKSPLVFIEEGGKVNNKAQCWHRKKLCLLEPLKTVMDSAKMVSLHKHHISSQHSARSSSVASGT